MSYVYYLNFVNTRGCVTAVIRMRKYNYYNNARVFVTALFARDKRDKFNVNTTPGEN